MRRQGFIGIDVACRKGKPMPVAISVWDQGRLVPSRLRKLPVRPPRGEGNLAALDEAKARRLAKETAKYINEACDLLDLKPARIAIDAPMMPRDPSLVRRRAEVAMDERGISCFATPSPAEFALIADKVRRHIAEGGSESELPHANQLWMLVGFALFKELSPLAPCIEVFPQAIAHALGADGTHKSQPGSVGRQLAAAARHTGWPQGPEGEAALAEIAWGPAHDRLDAYLASWVAALDASDRVALGEPPSDAIWIPRLPPPQLDPAIPTWSRRPAAGSAIVPKQKATGPRVERHCPSCGTYLFKQWPLGWDSHAAHTCTGLVSREPKERKAEFRRLFLPKRPRRRPGKAPK